MSTVGRVPGVGDNFYHFDPLSEFDGSIRGEEVMLVDSNALFHSNFSLPPDVEIVDFEVQSVYHHTTSFYVAGPLAASHKHLAVRIRHVWCRKAQPGQLLACTDYADFMKRYEAMSARTRCR